MYTKKIFIQNQGVHYPHRSGWPYVISCLKNLETKNGIIFETFIEKKFVWGIDIGDKNNMFSPYTEPWIGFFHVPDNIPKWFDQGQTPQELFKNKFFLNSLKYCKGLYCLSHYEKETLEKYTQLPIHVVFHPTETPEKKFDFEKFLQNEHKEIIQLGSCLRKLSSIYLLPTKKYQKSALGFTWKQRKRLCTEEKHFNININLDDVKIYEFLCNEDYDEILSKNIMFMDLYTSSANNAIIECIVRNTPLLINPLPAVKEYLGEDYPFYFHSLKEAAEKLEDTQLIKTTVTYLENLKIKEKLTGDAFLRSIYNSTIYRDLEVKNLNKLEVFQRWNFQFISFIFIIFTKILYLPVTKIVAVGEKGLYFVKMRMNRKSKNASVTDGLGG